MYMDLQSLFAANKESEKEELKQKNLHPRKILITGIGGMVASHLADLCLEKGDQVWGTYRWNEDLSNISHIKGKINLVSLDLNDAWSCLKVIETVKPDAISHLAAQSYVSDSFVYPAETIQTNVIGTLNLLEAVRITKERWWNDAATDFNPLIHVCSSSEVYGLVKQEDVPIRETQAFNPANPYAVGKVGTDMLALMYYTNYGLKTIRTRMFTHTSGRRKMLSAECNFARQIALIEVGKQSPVLKHGNLDSIRTWAHAKDAVEAYYLILTKPKKFGEVYNIGGKVTRTIGEMLSTMLSYSTKGNSIRLEQDPSLMRPYDVTLQIPDVSKFKQDYPEWEPKISFEGIIKDVLDGWRRRT